MKRLWTHVIWGNILTRHTSTRVGHHQRQSDIRYAYHTEFREGADSVTNAVWAEDQLHIDSTWIQITALMVVVPIGQVVQHNIAMNTVPRPYPVKIRLAQYHTNKCKNATIAWAARSSQVLASQMRQRTSNISHPVAIKSKRQARKTWRCSFQWKVMM